MKKTAAVICAIVMVLSLASCGKSTPDLCTWDSMGRDNKNKRNKSDSHTRQSDRGGCNAGNARYAGR